MKTTSTSWAVDLLEPHLDAFDKNNRSAPYFAKAIRELIKDSKRLDWLESGPVLPIDCSMEPGVEIEFQKRARVTRKSIDEAMNGDTAKPEANP